MSSCRTFPPSMVKVDIDEWEHFSRRVQRGAQDENMVIKTGLIDYPSYHKITIIIKLQAHDVNMVI